MQMKTHQEEVQRRGYYRELSIETDANGNENGNEEVVQGGGRGAICVEG